ncbi:MAG: MFS transporter [Chloroflexota bacterium]
MSNPLAFLLNPRQHPTNMAYTNGFAYGAALNMLGLLMPLYALDLGFRLSDQGIIVAAPAVFMIILRLPGGAISDRFGEKFVLWFSFASLVVNAVVAFYSHSIWPLILAQLFNGASRSVYWSAGQSYASRSAEGNAGHVMGRLLSFESFGGIIGGVIAGFVAQVWGFPVAFALSGAVALAGVGVTSALPPLPRKDQMRSYFATLKPAVTMLGKPSLTLAHLTAFAAAAYGGLVAGLFLAFFREAGYEEGLVGVVRSLNSAGLAAVAYVFGTVLGRLGARNTAMTGMVLTGVFSIATVLTGDVPVLPIVLMVLAGATFGSLRALYPALAAQNSPPNLRGVALSAVSLYWAFAMLLSPLVFGFVADTTGVRTAIVIFGVISVGLGLAAPIAAVVADRGRARDAARARAAESASAS